MRGGGDKYVRWYTGTWWVAFAWEPPEAPQEDPAEEDPWTEVLTGALRLRELGLR